MATNSFKRLLNPIQYRGQEWKIAVWPHRFPQCRRRYGSTVASDGRIPAFFAFLRNASAVRGPTEVLHTEIVVDGMIEFLLAAQVTLGRLNRCVAQQQLNLLQFSTRQVAQPGAGTTQIVRGEIS